MMYNNINQPQMNISIGEFKLRGGGKLFQNENSVILSPVSLYDNTSAIINFAQHDVTDNVDVNPFHS